MVRQALILCIYLFISLTVFAQQITIKGNAKSYAGDILKWKTYDDQITFKERDLAKCKVKENGDFELKFEVSETILSFVHLSVFKGVLFIEPGKEYQIVLPKKVKKLPEDELNPFFEETEFYIRVLNAGDNEINEQIKNFNRLYDNYLTKYLQKFKGKLNKSIADSIEESINKIVPFGSNEYFNNYKTYNYALLRLMAYERNKEKLVRKYFHNKPILYQNPAYMDLFNHLFTNYLSYYSKSEFGKRIPYFLIREKSLKKIKTSLSQTEVLQNDTLQELIICKSLFDNFYKEDYPLESIIFMIDSVKIAASTNENRSVANNIFDKITTLLLNHIPPDFELLNSENKLNSLAQFRNKFVYLNFINPKSYTCIQELELLKKLSSRKLEIFKIVSICVSNDIQEMKKFVKDNDYNWTFLYYANNQDLLKKYNIKVYPTFYLLNPESKLVMSPAFPPSEPSFEARYIDMLKAWKKEIQLRKAKGKSGK